MTGIPPTPSSSGAISPRSHQKLELASFLEIDVSYDSFIFQLVWKETWYFGCRVRTPQWRTQANGIPSLHPHDGKLRRPPERHHRGGRFVLRSTRITTARVRPESVIGSWHQVPLDQTVSRLPRQEVVTVLNPTTTTTTIIRIVKDSSKACVRYA